MKTLVFAESQNGHASTTAGELISKGREFGDVTALALNAAVAEELRPFGPQEVLVADLGDRTVGQTAAHILAELARSTDYDLVMLPQSADGRDVTGFLAAILDRTMIANAIRIERRENGVLVSNEIAGGTKIVRTQLTGSRPYIVAFRPKSFEVVLAESATVIRQWDGSLPASTPIVTEHCREEQEGPSLDKATVVVSGGRPLKTFKHYDAIVGRIARAIPDAAMAATRAIVDNGVVPHALQVGQTGKTVKPKVYIALGISGATQHIVGMKDADVIVAVNKDPDAPIFDIADLGIVGDVDVVGVQIAEALEARGFNR